MTRSNCVTAVAVRPRLVGITERFQKWIQQRAAFATTANDTDTKAIGESIINEGKVYWFSMNLKRSDCHNVVVLHTDTGSGVHGVRYYEHVNATENDEAHYELVDMSYHNQLGDAITTYMDKWESLGQ